MWRPKNWLTLYRKFYRISGIESSTRDTFEAGADAMLEELLNGDNFIAVSKGAIVTPGFMTDLDEYLFSLGNGKFVFIPDEENGN